MSLLSTVVVLSMLQTKSVRPLFLHCSCNASDQVNSVQHNGAGTVKINNFFASDFGRSFAKSEPSTLLMLVVSQVNSTEAVETAPPPMSATSK